jgi:hypothetical protein
MYVANYYAQECVYIRMKNSIILPEILIDRTNLALRQW